MWVKQGLESNTEWCYMVHFFLSLLTCWQIQSHNHTWAAQLIHKIYWNSHCARDEWLVHIRSNAVSLAVWSSETPFWHPQAAAINTHYMYTLVSCINHSLCIFIWWRPYPLQTYHTFECSSRLNILGCDDFRLSSLPVQWHCKCQMRHMPIKWCWQFPP